MALDLNNLDTISVGLASPEMILEWSHGEVTKAETINYRSQKPVDDGLFCEKIFGPTKDFECACGKYKKQRFSGTKCDRCGVDIVSKDVRRERMGHIHLAVPCTHLWYLKGTPNRIAFLLDVQPKQLDDVVITGSSYIVINPGECTQLKKYEILDEKAQREKMILILQELIDTHAAKDEIVEEYFETELESLKDEKNTFNFDLLIDLIKDYKHCKFGIGGEAIKTILDNIDIEEEYFKVQKELKELINSKKSGKNMLSKSQKKTKLIKRLEVLKSFYDSKQKPSWMVLENLPVIPPDLRPMLQLDGGRYATSDLNDLYRLVIIRNNSLKDFMESAPGLMVNNTKRLLQQAVDQLIDNSKAAKTVTSSKRALKSLTDSLKGKQGRFRQNLLGKRVDYSGRSVIAVGPTLKMYQCGLPREMAIELFRPFIIHEIMEEDKGTSTKQAEGMINRNDPKVNDIIERIIKDHYVLLNRAPTLHRLGIQAFQPVLVEGRAIRLHPLVCTGFNADFDGDQMAVHIPLSRKAQKEAEELMIANHNILGPKDGKPICIPTQDMITGNYYLTMEMDQQDFINSINEFRQFNDVEQADELEEYRKLEGKLFGSVKDVLLAYETGQVHLHTRIIIKGCNLHKTCFTKEQNNSYLVTTVGKVIFNSIFPEDFPFINDASKISNDPNSNCKQNLDEYFVKFGETENLYAPIKVVRDIKEYIKTLPTRQPIGKKSLGPIINELFLRYGADKTSRILDDIKDQGFKYSTIAGLTVSLYDMPSLADKQQLIDEGDRQVEIINNLYKDGEYSENGRYKAVISVWENIKTKVEKELKALLQKEKRNPVFIMANSGARGSIGNFVSLLGIRGLMVSPKGETIEIPIKSNFREGSNVSEYFIASHGARKGGTDTALKTADSGYLTRRLIDVSHNVIIKEEDCGCDHGIVVQTLVDDKDKTVIAELKDRIIGRFAMRDVVDPQTNKVIVKANSLIDEKLATEIINANIKQVEIRSLLTCECKDGVCVKCYGRNTATGNLVEIGDAVGIMAAQSIGEPGTQLTLKNFHSGGTTGADITQGLPRVQELLEARNPRGEATISPIPGTIKEIVDNNGIKTITIFNELSEDQQTIDTFYNARLLVKVGDHVENGQALTEGAIDPKKLLEYADYKAVQEYLIKEVLKVYSSQGIGISDKHIEVIVRQMTRKGIILDGGDTDLLPGMRSDIIDFTNKNEEVLNEGKQPARIRPILLGITKSALDTNSFLSSASFQETTKVLTDAAVKNKVDHLVGLKENVMVGKLIPAGTGINPLKSFEQIDEENSLNRNQHHVSFNKENITEIHTENYGIDEEDNINVVDDIEVSEPDSLN